MDVIQTNKKPEPTILVKLQMERFYNHSGEGHKLFWGSGVSRKAEIEAQWRQASKIQFPQKGIVAKCQWFREQTEQLGKLGKQTQVVTQQKVNQK